MDQVDIRILVCLLLAFSLYVRAVKKLWIFIHGSEKKISAWLQVLYITAAVIFVLVMYVGWLPLPVFYLLLYGTNCMSWLVNLRKDPWEWLSINIRFLILAAPHLIVVGIMALCAQTDVAGVLNDMTLRTLSLVIVILLNVLLLPLLMRYLNLHHQQSSPNAMEELRLFSNFAWFCSCSVVFDSIPCLFTLPTIFPLIFLIGSNVLLLMMALLFAHHVYTIMEDSYLKEKSMRLWEETIVQHSRMAQLEQEAYLDVLTKLYTRQYAISNMSSMLKSGESFALAFLDLDGLKQVNDQQGHLAGDTYLQTFSTHMKESLRPNDIFARYGGDEFLILMPDLTLKAAHETLTRIQLEATAVPPAGWGVPFSYGLVETQPGEKVSVEEWISRADSAMYRNKKCRKAERGGGKG